MVGGNRPFSIGGLVCAGLLLTALAGAAAPVPLAIAEPLGWTPSMPPPLAPTHGHRHAHRSGALLRFDSGLGVYTVSGAAGVYYFADAFIRRRDGVWEFSPRPSGPWASGRAEWVPLKLRAELYWR